MGEARVGQDSGALTNAESRGAPAGNHSHFIPLLILAGLAAITAFQFFVFPGHTWLASQTTAIDTKTYAPMLERLGAPGLLSRDLVATHPVVTYTVYDEATLFLRKMAPVDLRQALEIQQLAFRFAAVAGVFLLARAAGMPRAFSLFATFLGNFGAWIWGAGVALVDPDPAPYAFALGGVLLAAGLFATGRPLSGGLAGGIALLYDVRIAVPFWILVILAAAFSRESRSLARASLPVLLIFALLLANLAQLQPGATEPQTLWGRIPSAIATIRRFRSPELWIRSWQVAAFALCFLILACWAWAMMRLWPRLHAPARWMFAGLPLAGVLSLPLSLVLLDWAHREAIPQLQPTVLLLFPFAFCIIVSTIAGLHALREGRHREAAVCFLVVAALPFNAPRHHAERDIDALATWALAHTWGGSMFLFPDAGSSSDPAVFRAESKRPVWVDWDTGKLANMSDSFADEWHRRWQDTMAGEYSTKRLARLLSLPIDYYVLQRGHAFARVRPVFTDSRFVVYEANDLRAAASSLR